MAEGRINVGPRTWARHLHSDLRLEIAGGMVLALDFLPWDSAFFGLPCFRLNPAASCGPEPGFDDKTLSLQAASFPRCAVWAKLGSESDPALGYGLQTLGARYIETEVTLRHDGLPRQACCVEGVLVVKTDTLALEGYLDLGHSFSLTRFHLDPRIGRGKADALWVSFLKGFVPSPIRHAFVAQEKDKVIGAILITIENLASLAINCLDIVAVAPGFQGRGVGGLLMQKALDWCGASGRPTMVSTQHRNTAALSFYQKHGMVWLQSPASVFHLWTGANVME